MLQGRQRGRSSPAVTPSAPSAGAPNAERRSGARPAVVVLAAQRETAPAALTAQRQALGEGPVPSRGTHRRRHQPQPRRPWVGDGRGPRGIRQDPCARRGRGGRHGTDASDGGPLSGAERRGTSGSRPGPPLHEEHVRLGVAGVEPVVLLGRQSGDGPDIHGHVALRATGGQPSIDGRERVHDAVRMPVGRRLPPGRSRYIGTRTRSFPKTTVWCWGLLTAGSRSMATPSQAARESGRRAGAGGLAGRPRLRWPVTTPPPDGLWTTTVGTAGPRVAFLHGLFGQGRNWTQIAKALAGPDGTNARCLSSTCPTTAARAGARTSRTRRTPPGWCRRCTPPHPVRGGSSSVTRWGARSPW